MTLVKDNLMAANEFKPNLFLFDQEEAPIFGSIKLDGHWLKYEFI
jgi:hypothetical protein